MGETATTRNCRSIYCLSATERPADSELNVTDRCGTGRRLCQCRNVGNLGSDAGATAMLQNTSIFFLNSRSTARLEKLAVAHLLSTLRTLY